MKIDLPVSSHPGALADVADTARAAERDRFDGVAYSETTSDPMLHLTIAAGATERVDLLSNIVVAFGRSPMTLAMQARAIHDYSGGRLVLGLGSQIKPHIERRFSMPWSSPAPRMAEYVAAMRAIWHAWETGEKLDFRGDFYSHTLMTPMFTPPSEQPAPRVLVAAVGTKMTETVGRVADGILLHAFTTDRYVREVTIPALQRGRGMADTPMAAPEIVASGFVVTGTTEDEFAESKIAVQRQLAFYGSTPAYKPVFDLHGLGELGVELNTLSKSDRPNKWAEMGELIDDDVLGLFAAVGTPQEAAAVLHARLGDVATRYVMNSVGVRSTAARIAIAEAIRDADRPQRVPA